MVFHGDPLKATPPLLRCHRGKDGEDLGTDGRRSKRLSQSGARRDPVSGGGFSHGRTDTDIIYIYTVYVIV